MYMRRILALILTVTTLATAVSCSSGNGSRISGVNSDALKSGNSKELTMYVMDYDATAKNAVEKFNKTHKDVQIKVKNTATTASDELSSKLMYGLNNNQGPDIILCEQSVLPNLSVFFDKGSFFDLNTLIKNDKSFKQSDYFEKVLDYGTYKEKRFVIPLSYKISSLYTTKNILNKYGQGISDKGAGINVFVSAATNHATSEAAKDKYFISDIDFGSLMQTSAKPFFDLEKKEASFKSKEFGDLMDKYKTMSGVTCPEVMITSPVEKNNLLSSDKLVFENLQTMGPRYVAEPYGSFKSEVEPVIMPSLYADKTCHVIAKPEKYIGINSKCGNVQAAYDFIKLLLSKEYQDIDIMEGIPVNRQAYEQEKENCLKGMKGYDSWKKGGCKNAGTLKKLYSQLDELISNIDRCWTPADYILTIVQNEVDNYIKSNSTKENTLKTIQEKVEGYLKNGIMIESLNKVDDTPTDPTKTVSLYYWDDPCYVNNAEYAFKQKYPDLFIKKKTFISLSEFYKTTAIEIMAGGGPDIVIFDPRWYNSIEKTIQNGAFCEMDEYIKKYDILSGDYNKNLLKAGVYNGKRYYIPLYYQFDTFLSSKQILEDNGIKIDKGNWTWDKFASYAADFMKKNKGKSRYFTSAGFEFADMLRNCEIPLIDYTNKKSNFNSDAFRKLLNLYKEVYPAINPEYTHNSLENKIDVMVMLSLGSPRVISIYGSEYSNTAIGEVTMVDLPTLTGVSKHYVIQNDCIAVNSNCKNKDIAFKYVKIAASYEMQRDCDSRGLYNNYFGMPVNDKSFKDDILSRPVSKQLPKLVEDLLSIRGDMEECNVKEYNIRQMANNLAIEYAKGNKTIEQVVSEIDEKVNVFLNE